MISRGNQSEVDSFSYCPPLDNHLTLTLSSSCWTNPFVRAQESVSAASRKNLSTRTLILLPLDMWIMCG